MKGEIAMKKTTRTVCWTVLLTAVLLIPAFAQDNAVAGKRTADNQNRYEAAVNRLNLSAEQKGKIGALRQDQRQQMMELQQSLKEARAKLKEHLDNPEATRESVAPLAAEIKALTAKMIDQRIDAIFAAKETLTPDQLNKLPQFRRQRTGEEKGGRPFWLERRRSNKEEINQEK